MKNGVYLQLHSVHGLIRGESPELGFDADTGGQVVYVLELARALSTLPRVDRVEILTRRIEDPAVAADYAAPVEQIAEKAWIVRIPFGGPGYIRKEELWPHLDGYVDGVLAHVRSLDRLPDVLHSHYADAGYACNRLSRLLDVPQIHTSHSLGRAKRAKLVAAGDDADEFEERYHFERRISEEEAALSNAALIIASTHEERRLGYSQYEADTAAKIQVIPPGIDVSRFFPYFEGRSPEVVKKMNAEFQRFLKDNDKPPILAISRPDRNKNLAALVTAFGEDEGLKEIANLVIFAGTRQDIGAMPEGERDVLIELLVLMDKYDLYGKIALPKSHEFETDVPALYRMAARKGGIFVNVSHSESFGLTLLEAAASGLPLVATNTGGPPDIVGACRNGIIVPSTDTRAIARAMKAILSDAELWHQMSDAGIRGVRAHYSWEAHVEAYMAFVEQVASGETVQGQDAELPRIRKLVVCDVDDVLTGDLVATDRLKQWLAAHREEVHFAVTTGRSLGSMRKLLAPGNLPEPDFLIAGAGTELYKMPGFRPVGQYAASRTREWDRGRARKVLDGFPELLPQEATAQSPRKLSYYVGSAAPSKLVRAIVRGLGSAGCASHVQVSNGNLLDVVPQGESKADAVAWLAARLGLGEDDVLVCGDSEDDAGMLALPFLGVVPAGHRPELESAFAPERVYFAASAHADAVLEAVAHWGLLARPAPQPAG